MATIFMLRHGDTEYSKLKNICGVSNPPLSGEGRRKALKRKAALEEYHFDSTYTSPLIRCTETLQIMAPEIRYEIDSRLIEIDFGELEGKPIKDVFSENRDTPDTYSDDWETYHFPKGDNMADYFDRAGETVRTFAGKKEDAILLVTHNGFINSVIANLVYRDIGKLFTVPCHTCDIIKLWEENGRFHHEIL